MPLKFEPIIDETKGLKEYSASLSKTAIDKDDLKNCMKRFYEMQLEQRKKLIEFYIKSHKISGEELEDLRKLHDE